MNVHSDTARSPWTKWRAFPQWASGFAQSVLRWIVYTRIYMYKTSEAEKQQICEEIGIRLAQQHAIDYKTRRTKKLGATRQR